MIGIGYLFFRNATAPKVEYITEKAVLMNLKQTVSATGRVDSEEAVDLKFNAGGDIAKIYVVAGDPVANGKILAELKHTALDSQIKEARAALSLQQANYLKTLQGARQEEIIISMRRVESAQSTYDAAVRDYQALSAKLQSDIASLQTQIKNYTQALVDVKTSAELNIQNSRTNLLISLNQAGIKSVNSQRQVETIFNDIDLEKNYGTNDITAKDQSHDAYDGLQYFIDTAKSDYVKAAASLAIGDIRVSVASSTLLLTKVEEMLKWVLQALNATSISYGSITEAELTAYKTAVKNEQDVNNAQKVDLQSKSQAWESATANLPININTAQANLDTATSNLNATTANNQVQLAKAQSAIDSSKVSLNLAKAELDLTKAKARSADISIAQAQVNQAQSAVDRLLSQLTDFQIITPFDGMVGKVNFKENESVTSQDVIISMIGQNLFKISVDIPESDIAKISVDNTAAITLDAYSSDQKFSGKVVNINLSETLIQDVVYYKVEVTLDHSDQVIKTGMSANLDILTNQKNGVIVVPVRAVLVNTDGTKYVRILKDGQVLKAAVTTGLRGDEGKIEIVSGVMDGDEVITFEKTL